MDIFDDESVLPYQRLALRNNNDQVRETAVQLAEILELAVSDHSHSVGYGRSIAKSHSRKSLSLRVHTDPS